MTIGFDQVGHSQELQRHWLHRVVAGIIDGLIVSLPLYLLIVLLFWKGAGFWMPGLLVGVAWFIYGFALEATSGTTLGKMLLGLKVTDSSGGRLKVEQAALRNLSRLFVPALVLDFIVGLATEGDPHQKISDRFAKCIPADAVAQGGAVR